MEEHDERTAARPSCGRSEAARNPGLPADQGPARIRRGEAGADLAVGQARLSDPRRHSDHAAGGSPRPGVTRSSLPIITRASPSPGGGGSAASRRRADGVGWRCFTPTRLASDDARRPPPSRGRWENAALDAHRLTNEGSQRLAAEQLRHLAGDARRLADEPMLEPRQPVDHAEADVANEAERVGAIG